jgi:hypothetical protein
MFWFERYIGVCSVAMLYLLMFSQQLPGYFTTAEICHQLIAQSALEKVITASYAAIVDELKEVENIRMASL